ncbi:MAG: twin-arginine translocase TatA/TatE family subunit [Kiritimatiellia bacterium]
MITAFLIPGMSGPFEVLLILFVILLLFGARRLPELSRSLGKSLGEFKKGREEGEKELKKTEREESDPAQFDSTAQTGEPKDSQQGGE